MLDLRLTFPAASCWAVTATALTVPRAVTVALIAVLVASSGVAVLCVRRDARRRAAGVTVAAVCGVGALAGVAVLLRVLAVEDATIVEATGKTTVAVRVTGDPVHFAGQRRLMVPVTVERVGGVQVRPVAARLHAQSTSGEMLPGERYAARVRVAPVATAGADRLIAADLGVVGDLVRTDEAPWWQTAAGEVRLRLRETAARALGDRAGGLLPGLILGDTSGLDQQTRDAFRRAGLSHLVAVSGANVALTVGAVVLCVRASGAPPGLVFVVGVMAVVGFVVLVRPTDSVLRAAVMGSVGLSAGLSSRRAQALPALGAAVVVVVLWWPEMALAPGFALSVAATLGLVLWAAPMRLWLTGRGVPDWAATLLAMTAAAQVLTTPIVIALTDQVSVFSVPANLLAALVVPVIGVIGTAGAVFGAFGGRHGLASVMAELAVRATAPGVKWLIAVADRLGGPAWVAPTVPGVRVAGVTVLIAVAVTVGVRCLRALGDVPECGRGGGITRCTPGDRVRRYRDSWRTRRSRGSATQLRRAARTPIRVPRSRSRR